MNEPKNSLIHSNTNKKMIYIQKKKHKNKKNMKNNLVKDE